jgi:glycosyltransferase involved in cell wall biosynthesis
MISPNNLLIRISHLIDQAARSFRRTAGTSGPAFIEGIRTFCPLGVEPAKRALISLAPFAWITALAESPNIRFFNICGLTYEMVKALNTKGYSVDIVDCGIPGFEPQKGYDVFLGHGGHTRSILDSLPTDTFVLNYASGAYWKEFNRMSQERYDDFCRRKGLPSVRNFQRSLRGTEEGEEYLVRRADATFLSGPRTVATFNGIVKGVYLLYLGACIEKDYLVDDRDFNAGRNNFVYVAGTGGNVQKGMDLILEAFARMPDLHLYIYCKVEEEVRRAYRRELALPNIHFVLHYSKGPLRSQMKKLLKKINFTIGAPMDTGPGTALLGSMGLGLIPVGYIDIEAEESNSVLTNYCSIESLTDSIRQASEKSAAWCREASRQTLDRFQRLHDPRSFGANFKTFLDRLGL